MAVAESPPFSLTVLGAPKLSNFVAVGVTTTGADLFVNTDQSVGAIYLIADGATGVPSHDQIKDGNTSAGNAAAASGVLNVTSTGAQGPFRAEPFIQDSIVNCWAYHEVSVSNRSEVLGVVFRTLSQADIDAPPDTLVSFFNETGEQT